MNFSGRYTLNVMHFSATQGADLGELLEIVGKSEAELCGEEVRVEASLFNRMFEHALERTGDQYLGLHLGEALNLSAAGLIAQIVTTCSTVREALQYCADFAALGCRLLPIHLRDQGEVVEVVMQPDPVWWSASPITVQHTVDGYMAFSIREFHTLTRYEHFPSEIRLTIPRPEGKDVREGIFGCSVVYGAEENLMRLPRHLVDQPVVTSNYSLLQILVMHAQQKVAEIEGQDGFFNLVRKSVINMIKPHFPTIEQVAGQLNLSVRTLQRRLREEGHTYKEVLEALRKDFAMGYLRNATLSIGEVAYLLSYADTSAFVRSFKRWTGQTPRAWRERQR